MTVLLTLGLLAALSSPAAAQDGKRKGERHGRKREALLRKFDKDGDGRLSKEERKAAREAMRKEGKGKRGGLKKRAPKKFDRDGDGKLDRKEKRAFRRDLRLKRRG